ncbi:YcxB family protein [Amphibacillus sp. Q70]|uniref:YcxB family protein n=1 Tax=Amphibacillus sp. Q70 TaxID=3453416 RepID=UPI003F827A09
MDIKGELKFENLIALQMNYLKTSDKIRKRINMLKIIFAGTFFCSMFIIRPYLQLINIGINIVLTLIFAILVSFLFRKVVIQRLKKNDYNIQLLGAFYLHLTQEGIDIQRESSSKHVSWIEINKVTSDEQNFFLYFGNQSAIIIPKHSLDSDTQLIEFLSTHVGKSKIVNKPRVGLNRKQRSVVYSLLIIVLVLLVGAHYYYIQPNHNVSRATYMVNNLFINTDENFDLEKNEASPKKIKDSTDQEQIDRALKAITKIDVSKDRYKEYSTVMLALTVILNNAQQQLDQREGKQIPDSDNLPRMEFKINSDLSTIENLIENFPYLQSTFNEIPVDIQSKIVLPSLDDIPFQIEEVYINYNDRHESRVEVFYSGEGKNFTSSVWSYDEGLSKRGEEVQLIKDTIGYFFDDEYSDAITIHWSDREKDSKLLYAAQLAGDDEFTKEDVIQLTNSMIANEENVYSNPEQEYIPNKTDVILKNNSLENVDILDNFVKVAGENSEDQIRVVKYVPTQGVMIYDLQSKYDKNANEGWIEVIPDLSYYQALEDEGQDVFNNAPQQCGNMSKDIEAGYYKLSECRTHWEYSLLPIVSDNEL